MKKQIITINLHSIVDVITNSSSELFVLDDAKSIDAVKELLQFILQKWNELAEKGVFGKHYITNDRFVLSSKKNIEKKPIKTWEDTFGDIYIYTAEHLSQDLKKLGTWEGWGYEKPSNIGKIFIVSAEDNSIPYEMFDWIETVFNGERFHLG